MATYEITAPDGAVYQIDGPEGASEDQIIAALQGHLKTESPQVSMAESAGRGALQGATFGFSDEIWGGLKGGYDTLANGGNFTDNYAHVRDETRAANERAQSANPGSYFAGELAGGVGVPVGAGATAARMGLRAAAPAIRRTFMERVRRGATAGAGYGAAYGLGTSSSDPLTQLGDTLGDTAKGAGYGLMFGAALPPVVDAGGAIASKVFTPFRAMLNPKKVGQEKVAEALMRDRSPGGVPSPNAIDTVAAKLDDARQTKPEMMLGDLGGENTRNLMRSAANQPSTAAQKLNRTLDSRQSNQWRRIERDIATGLEDPNIFQQSVDDLAAQMDEAGRNIIQPALRIETPMTDKLAGVLKRPTAKGLHELAARRLADEGREIGLVNRTEMLHRMKMELDDQIGMAKRAEAMGNKPQAGWDARTLTVLKHDLLNAIDNPTYKAGLKQYAGKAQLRNAAQDGFDDALKIPTEEIPKVLRGMTADEQRMWRLGAARALAGKIRQGNVNRDRTENVFSSPDIQLRMKAIFPNQGSLREFQRRLVMEAKMADTRKAVQGSSTTAKQLAQGQEAAQPVRWLQDTANIGAGRFAQPILAYLGRQAQRFSGITPSSANAILETAMSKDGAAVAAALRAAEDKALRAPRRRQGVADAITRGLIMGGGPNEPQGLVGQTPYRRRFDEFGNPIP